MDAKWALVAGGTGFLGQYIVWGLVKKGFSVVALHQKGISGSCEQRLDKLIERNKKCAKNFTLAPEQFKEITFIESDISQPDLGLTPETYNWLASLGISEVWNSAADMRYSAACYCQSYATNVAGSLHLAELARNCGHCTYFHVSTAFIGGKCFSDGTQIREELPQTDNDYYNSYDKTKALAEQKISDFCTQNNLAFSILRPTIVIGDTQTGFTSSGAGFYEYIAAVRRVIKKYSPSHLRIEGCGEAQLNLIPVDFCVDVMMRISANKARSANIYTISDSRPLVYSEVMDIIGQLLGVRIECVPVLENDVAFYERLFKKLTGKNHIFSQQSFCFCNHNTRAVLGDNFCSQLERNHHFFSRILDGFKAYQKEMTDG